MGFFKTKDPKTGEPRLGAGVYLIICGLMIGGVVLWNLTKDSNAGVPKAEQDKTASQNQSSVMLIAEAAQNHDEKLPELEESSIAQQTDSDREAIYQSGVEIEEEKKEVKTADTVDDTFEILRQSQERSEREKAAAVAKARAEARAAAQAEIDRLRALAEANGQDVPTEVATPTRTSRRVRRSRRSTNTASKNSARSVEASEEDPVIDVNSDALVVYDVNRDNPPAPAEVVQVNQPTGFDTGDFLPRGQVFPIYILSTVQSVGQEDIVIMAVAENVIFQNKVQIPFGTRLLGQAAATSFEDRIAINVDTILYPDGRELPVSAFLKDPYDMSSGVRGYYIPQPLRVQLIPYINEFMSSWLEAVADRSRSNDRSSSSSFNANEDTIDGSSNLIRSQANKIQSRLDARYPEKVVIPIGTKAYVQLRSPLDLTRARVAGSFFNTQPILPGFENNPIRPSGVIEQTANGKPNSAGISSLGTLGSMLSLPNANTAQTTAATTPKATTSTATKATPTTVQQSAEMKNYLKMLNEMSDSLDKKKSSSSSTGWMSGDL